MTAVRLGGFDCFNDTRSPQDGATEVRLPGNNETGSLSESRR